MVMPLTEAGVKAEMFVEVCVCVWTILSFVLNRFKFEDKATLI